MFIDTNVLLDIVSADPIWSAWSERKVILAARDGEAVVNVVVIAEMSRGFGTVDEITGILSGLTIDIVGLDHHAAFVAGKRFAAYRQQRQDKRTGRVLPDFLIGAHALMLGRTLVTRDTAIYRAYFPDLTLITPETQP